MVFVEIFAGGGAFLAFAAGKTLLKLFVEWRPPLNIDTKKPPPDEEEFDFIVVGAGSAGAVIAARLIEDPDVRVLLLEAGQEDTHKYGSGFFKLPIAALGFQATPHHWGYETESEPELMMKGEHWAPDEGCRGRPLIQTRGKVLGGSSSINLCNYIRGHPDDFNNWGLAGWSWREMLGYFRRFEKLETSASDSGRELSATPTTPHEKPIAVSDISTPHSISVAFVAGCARWLGRTPQSPHPHAAAASSPLLNVPSQGAGLHCVTVSDGVRCSNAAALRTTKSTAAITAGRLVVLTAARVLKIHVDDVASEEAAREDAATISTTSAPSTDKLHARGVIVHCADGKAHSFRASKEVLLCAGAINTPQLLLLSGIGPARELREVGIAPRHDLPEVGKHLRDVAAVGICAKTDHVTLDKELRTPWPYLRYLFLRSGPLASNTLEASAFIGARHLPDAAAADAATTDATTSDGGRPWLQLLVQPMLFPFASWGKFKGFVEQLKAGSLPSAFAIHVVLLHPASSGSVTLEQRNPFAKPAIRNQYLKDPNDLRALVHGIRIAREILQQSHELRVRSEVLPGEGVESDEELAEYVRANACHFNGSLCGSCRMARAEEPGVLDEELRVRGVRGLRVVDASALPALVCGQLNSAVTALAEKAADLIAATHSLETVARQSADLERAASPQWAALYTALLAWKSNLGSGDSTARDEAARALIRNHQIVVRDATNASPRSQLELKRVEPMHAEIADAALREVARRLLGASAVAIEEQRPTSAQQAAVWVQTAEFVASRIGVPRDMSADAAAAMRAALAEVAESARPVAHAVANEMPGHRKTD